MKLAIEKMKSHSMHTDRSKPQAPVTYARSLRAAALALANRQEDRPALKDDVEWLIKAHVNGAYTYDDRFAGLPVVPADPNRIPKDDRKESGEGNPLDRPRGGGRPVEVAGAGGMTQTRGTRHKARAGVRRPLHGGGREGDGCSAILRRAAE